MSRKNVVIPVGLAFVAVVVAAVNLRAGIASLGPVLSDVLGAFGASGSLAGLITAMPGVLFGIMGLCAVPLARRMGLSRVIVIGMVLALVGLAARPWVGGIAWFILLSGLVVAGIAVGNVLIPAWVKSYGGRRTVAMMTAYGALLGLSGALGPLSALWFSGDDAWRWALFVWGVLAAVQVVVWLGVAWRTGFDFPSTPEPEPVPAEPGSDAPASADASGDAASGDAAATRAALTSVSLWRSPTAVFLTMFFALQSMNAYLQMGWMPQMYVDAGVSRDTASVALSLVGALNILGGLLMPTIIDRARSLAPFPLVFAVLTAAGYLGILLAPTTTPLLWAFLLGIGGFCFPTAIALIPARSRSPLVTARLSGFVQPMGYFLAGLGPFAIGLVYEATGSWTVILSTLVVLSLVMGLVGVRAGRNSIIDDELTAPHWREYTGH
ncbi:MAG: MFS transporter [Corynebacterium sp.]|uniref:MFS transporter n=1 Tax=Corynebacterium TaxID=1716 RepID=UPI0026494466|nr:MFS transporter [Corynebacterium sp.]MDN5724004.1 MFS transporter [Corynebacterium sp.]MDN6284041.1 MFS transporter [Corynebacterium sp.]MDN6305441.1 MFS transporter [Corynebacterium sp.]MDN6353864.1 MFS transporter [Corynebacterium sp.]MDN6367857.1 MFS transporter [Corynebacterium sp.]